MLTDSLRNPTGLAAPSTTWILTTLVFLLAVGLFACAPDPQPSAVPELISSGSEFTCMLQADGSPVCWGVDGSDQSPPLAGETFASISVGINHTCALREDGAPICWGNDGLGQSSPPAGETFVVISSGGAHTCALRKDGSPACWAQALLRARGAHPNFGQSIPPRDEAFTTVSSGAYHTCVSVKTEPRRAGEMTEWAKRHRRRREVHYHQQWAHHTCALREDGTPVCWGDSKVGEATPPVGERFTTISSGAAHTCACAETAPRFVGIE